MILRRSMLCLLTAATLCAATGNARAQVPDLVTDRPDQTESSSVVPRGYVQLELGYRHLEDDEGGIELTFDAVPESLLRIGLGARTELRVGLAGYIEAELSGGAMTVEDDGFGDAALGFKVGLSEEQGSRPQTAVIGTLSLPVGDDAFTSDEVDPSFRLAFSHTLSERLSLGYNLGAAWTTAESVSGDEHTLSQAEWTAVIGISASERWGLFVELFGTTGLSAGGSPANSADGGLTYRIKDNLQFDLAAGFGISDAAPDWFAGVGLSVRFPR